MNRNRHVRAAALRPAFLRRFVLAGVLSAALAGCSGPPPELSSDAASELQSQVLAVTEAAAANDSAGALMQLDELVKRLDGAAGRGEVSFQRHQSISAAISTVRADLAAQIAAAEAAAQAAAEQAAAQAAAEQAAAEQAAAQAAAAQQAAAEQAAADAAAKNDKAKDKDKDKGKDKDD